jgi:hypothetical protein
MVQTFLKADIIINLNAGDKLLTLVKFVYNITINKFTRENLFEANLVYISYLLMEFLLTPKLDAIIGENETREFTNQIEI